MSKDPDYGRRHFLKDSALSFARAAREYVTQKNAPIEPTKAAPRADWLRPPGAVPEEVFLGRCTRCSDCVKACPFGSITIHAGDGTPVIFPDQVPCHLCEDFPCIAACGTDALLPVQDRTEVRMGLARVTHRVCTAGQGCHACVSQCPTTALALDLDAFRLLVDDARCVGCGICEQTCKTVNDKIAIKVVPARQVGA